LTPRRYPWPRSGSFSRSESAGRASGVCERVTTRWPHIGKLLSIWGSGLAGASVFAILDLCGLSPRDMNLLVFEPVQPHIRSPLGRLHHDPACGGHELRKMKPF
jgi:hypothetical protein